MTTIYVIRHAEAEGNLYRIVQGQHNSFITPRGHRLRDLRMFTSMRCIQAICAAR